MWCSFCTVLDTWGNQNDWYQVNSNLRIASSQVVWPKKKIPGLYQASLVLIWLCLVTASLYQIVLKAQRTNVLGSSKHWCLKIYMINPYSIVIPHACCIPVRFPKFQIQLNYKTRENLLFFQLSLTLLQHITCSFWISDHVYVSIAQC